jgi:hypothetical protein
VEPLAVFEIDEEAGDGSGRVTVQERTRLSDGSTGFVLGTYHDRYVRGRHGWQFAERRLEVATETPNP